MAEYEYENLLFDRVGTDGRVGRLTLNRPEKMNALSQELLFELRDALENIESDDSIRVLIVRGAGRTFSAGYDLTPGGHGGGGLPAAFTTRDEKGRRLFSGIRGAMQRVADIHLYFWSMQKITIAQVHGWAIAGGCELTMMADLVTASEEAQLGHPGLRFAGSRTALIWPLVMNMRKAKELYYTGESVSGKRAMELEMINYAWPADELEERTTALADKIAIMPADHLALLKVNMNRFYENMGIYSSVRSSTDLDAAGQYTSQNYGWQEHMEAEGLKGALAWRDGPYQDYRSSE